MRRLTTSLIVLALAASSQAGAGRAPALYAASPLTPQNLPLEPLVIVVNRSNPVENVSFTELRGIFLGNRSHWTNGRRITLVMREPGEPERKNIIRDVCGMNEDQLKNHFLHGLFTGEILVSPKILATPTGVRRFIFNVPGAIGYLRMSDVDSSVKILRIDELLPDDKGYKLHVQSQAANSGD
jgi:ABC-type phosphate transport system substrate-binding protein